MIPQDSLADEDVKVWVIDLIARAFDGAKEACENEYDHAGLIIARLTAVQLAVDPKKYHLVGNYAYWVKKRMSKYAILGKLKTAKRDVMDEYNGRSYFYTRLFALLDSELDLNFE